MVIHIILLISQFIIALKWLIKYSKHYWYLKTNSLNYICFAKHELPGGPETALTKCTFSKKILFSLQRNTQFDRQHLAKFGHANLAKFAFRVGFWQNVHEPFSSFVRAGLSASR